jgi:hypothetical protein
MQTDWRTIVEEINGEFGDGYNIHELGDGARDCLERVFEARRSRTGAVLLELCSQ